MKREIMTMYVSTLVVLSGFCLIFGTTNLTKADQGEVICYLPYLGNCSTGLTWDGQNLWVADSGNGEIYKIDPTDGAILKNFTGPGDRSWGLAWDGQYLWHSDCSSNRIYKISPTDGTVVDSFLGKGHPHGLAWDGENLWNVDWVTKKIYKLNPTNGAVLKSFSSPGRRGLAWDGRHLWCSDSDDNNKLYKINPSNGVIISSFSSPGDLPYGLAWDGQHLWNADSREDKIFKIKITDVTGFVSPGDEPVGLKFDGQYLWNADAGTDKIYKICPLDGKVLYYVSSPGNNPTGLACDGQNLWVADSIDDVIYKVSSTGVVDIPSPEKLPWGLTWDGQYLWNVDDHADKIFKIDISSGEVLESFSIPWSLPRGLTYDGEFLWNADADTDKIYKINPNNGETIGSMDSPGNEPTGLTWDGQYLWNADAGTDVIYRLDTNINENFPPSKPTTPSGPTTLDIGETGEYVTSATDPNNDKLSYWFEWDDGSISEWTEEYASGVEVSQEHSWDTPGEYVIKVKAKDEYDSVSKESDTLTITVEQKNNPNKPSKPSGPSTGKPKKELTYTTSTTDPEGNDVFYMFDWGDGSEKKWIGPYHSGVKVQASHVWEKTDSYQIKVQAKDTDGYLSEWSEAITVTITRKPSSGSFLSNKLLENFPVIKMLLLAINRFQQKNI